MLDVVIIGAGGHAKVVIDLFRESGWNVVGCTSREDGEKIVNGVPILGTDRILESLLRNGLRHAFVALGDNRLRVELGRQLEEQGFQLPVVVAPSARISRGVQIQAGTAIMEGAIINADARIGRSCIVNTNASVDHDCIIMDGVHIAPGSALAGNVTVGEKAFLGVGVRVVPGVKIGSQSIVGAGATVVRDVPPGEVHVGVPASLLKLI